MYMVIMFMEVMLEYVCIIKDTLLWNVAAIVNVADLSRYNN